MSMTPTQAKARFVQIASLPDAAVIPFCDLIELLYGRNYRDNRLTRRRTIDRVVAELGMPLGHSSQLGDNLMQHCDSRYEFSTPHRDPHKARKRKPRTSGASGLMTPEPEQNLDGTTLFEDDNTPEGFGGGDETPAPPSPITTPSRPPRADANPALRAIIDALRAQVATLTKENNALKTEIADVREENGQLRDRTATLDGEVDAADQRADLEREKRLAGQQGISDWLAAEQARN